MQFSLLFCDIIFYAFLYEIVCHIFSNKQKSSKGIINIFVARLSKYTVFEKSTWSFDFPFQD